MAENTEATPQKIKRNQFGDIVEKEEPMTIENWEKRWAAGQTKFTLEHVHPMLQKHRNILLNGSKNQRVFLPLCGKSLDLKWLADEGYDVVGNEVVHLACIQFFQEHNLEFTEQPLSAIPGTIYKSKNQACKITLYCCDFYALTRDIIGTFDAIWDRGSLVAIDPNDRVKYSKVITKFMTPSTKYLFDCFEVDNETFAGPPFNMPAEEVKELFRDWCDLEIIEIRDALNDRYRGWGMKTFIATLILLKLKEGPS